MQYEVNNKILLLKRISKILYNYITNEKNTATISNRETENVKTTKK